MDFDRGRARELLDERIVCKPARQQRPNTIGAPNSREAETLQGRVLGVQGLLIACFGRRTNGYPIPFVEETGGRQSLRTEPFGHLSRRRET